MPASPGSLRLCPRPGARELPAAPAREQHRSAGGLPAGALPPAIQIASETKLCLPPSSKHRVCISLSPRDDVEGLSPFPAARRVLVTPLPANLTAVSLRRAADGVDRG